MSVRVLNVIESPDGCEGEGDLDNSSEDFVRTFLVSTSGVTNNASIIRRSRLVVQEGEAYGGGTSAICKKVRVWRDGDRPQLWYARASYEGQKANEVGSSEASRREIEESILEPIAVRVSGDRIMRPFVESADTPPKPVVNSVGMDYSPLPEVEDGIPWIEFRRNERDVGQIWAPRWRNTTNAGGFMGVLQREAMLRVCDADLVWTNDRRGYYWRATYLFAFKKGGWDIRIMDRGLYQYQERESTGSGTFISQELERITDANGVPVVEPVRLDGKGRKLGVGLPSFFFRYQAYPMRNFTSLRLPQWQIIL